MISLSFSAKESLFKAIYPIENKFLDFQDMELIDVDFANSIFRIVLSNRGEAANDQRVFLGRFRYCRDQVLTLITL